MKIFLIISGLFWLIFGFVPEGGAQSKLVLCGDPFPPYTLGTETDQMPTGGLAVKFVRQVFDRLEGVQATLVLRPFNRCLEEVEDGDLDGVFLVGFFKERGSWMAYTDEPYWHARLVLYYSKARYPDGIHWKTVDNLMPYSFGTLRGANYGKNFDTAVKEGKLHIEAVTENKQNFSKLLLGRIDIVPINELAGRALVKELEIADQVGTVVEPTLKGSAYFIGISKKSPAIKYLPRMNEIIKTLKSEGLVESIFYGEQ